MLYLYVAAGGAFGALMRYFATFWLNGLMGREFPYATLMVNVLGSFLMGVLLGLLATMMPRGRELYLLAGVGALGGFTTFSTFSYDSYMLLERGQWSLAALYMGGSVLLSVAAFVLGMWCFRLVSA